MNYHIMIDDKFTDGFIEDAEAVCDAGANRYFIRGDDNNRLHVKHPKAEFVKDIYSEAFGKQLLSLKNTDKLFVHWYDLHAGKLMLSIDKDIPLFVPLMGGDFYCEPLLHHMYWLFDPITLKYVKKTYLYPAVWAKHPLKLWRQWRALQQKKKNIAIEFALKKRTVERIGHILIDENLSAEVELTKKLYGIHELTSLPFNYNQNFDFARSLQRTSPAADKKLKIQIGNSATATNNHADAFEMLKRFTGELLEISVPLAYGDAGYASFVKEKGTKTFGEKIRYTEGFIPRETYIKSLLDTDICIMYHNRSQGFGNCITLLTLGKKLYLKKNNPLWDIFKKLDILVFDAAEISKIDFLEFKKLLTEEQVQQNIQKIEGAFSEEKRLSDVKKILN